MTIDKSFIQKIEEMAVPHIHEENLISYTDKALSIIFPPSAKSIQVCSLTSIIDYCERQLEKGISYILHIKDHETVVLMSTLDLNYRNRETIVVGGSFPSKFDFDTFMSVDKFIIALQAYFVRDETVENILKLVGNMTSSTELGTKDDGVTQRVEARVGLAKVENVSVPNPVFLAPYRTFLEIEQPASNFILRLNSDHKCALFEADGGFWKIAAMQSIKEYMTKAIESLPLEIKERITILA